MQPKLSAVPAKLNPPDSYPVMTFQNYPEPNLATVMQEHEAFLHTRVHLLFVPEGTSPRS